MTKRDEVPGDRSPVPTGGNVLHAFEHRWCEVLRFHRCPLKMTDSIAQRAVRWLTITTMRPDHRLDRFPVARQKEDHPPPVLRHAEVCRVIEFVTHLIPRLFDLGQDDRQRTQLTAEDTAHILNHRIARPDGFDDVDETEEQLPPGILKAAALSRS